MKKCVNCGKESNAVAKLPSYPVIGLTDMYICDECVKASERIPDAIEVEYDNGETVVYTQNKGQEK